MRFEHVGVLAGRRVILEDVTATAPAGGATVLVGPNGAGKTTLLHCLLGERRYTGQILFQWPDAPGQVPGQGPGEITSEARRPKMGYVPQLLLADANLPLRVHEFLALAGRRPLWLGARRGRRESDRQMLNMVAAGGLENSFLRDLSGGELRRVLLAAALLQRPELLLLDEPEAGVDYSGERLFWQLLDDARRQLGFTLIMISHNLGLAAHYATEVICINRKVRAQGPPKLALSAQNLLALYGTPIHLYPAQCAQGQPACPECGAQGLRHWTRNSGQPDRN